MAGGKSILGWTAAGRRALSAAVVTATLTGAGGMTAGCGGDVEPVAVMTRNLYLGADLTPLFFALSIDELAAGAAKTWNDVQASHFDQRATVLATEIVASDPDVVALQEATLFRTQTPGDWESGAAPNAEDVQLDLLQMLLDELAMRGAHYQTAAVGAFTDVEIPAAGDNGTSFDIRLTDRNVILIREGLTYRPGPTAAFNAEVVIPVGGPGGATVTLQRGYISSDVAVGSKDVRVVDSHLEVGGTLSRIQEAQAGELIAALAPYGGRLILAGDFNSPADGSDTISYARLTTGSASSAAFHDAWVFQQDKIGMGLLAGLTCCLDLAGTDVSPQQRIDLVLFRGSVQPVDAHVVQPAKTPSGLWPSDHLGVVAQLQLR